MSTTSLESYYVQNERKISFDSTIDYPFPNPHLYWRERERERNQQNAIQIDDMHIRHDISRSTFIYYYARKAGLVPEKTFPSWYDEGGREARKEAARKKVRVYLGLKTRPDEKDLDAAPVFRCMEWDRGFWGKDGRNVRGVRGVGRDSTGGYKVLDCPADEETSVRKANSAPLLSRPHPLLKLHPPRRAASAGPGHKLKLNPPRRPLSYEVRAKSAIRKTRSGSGAGKRAIGGRGRAERGEGWSGAGVKKNRRKRTVRQRPDWR